MLRFCLTLSFVLHLSTATIVQAQSLHEVRGLVLDATDGAPLPGATLQIEELAVGVVTDAHGRFELRRVPAGEHTLRVRFVGHGERLIPIGVPVGSVLRIELEPVVAESDEVIVTGVPVGGAAITRPTVAIGLEELTRRSAATLGEALDFAPGVSMRSFGPAPARPVVRGFDGDRVIVLENGERAGDVSETAADHAMSGDPLAADRVEVVRGPASLLYGSGAIGGVVNVITDDIPVQWERGLSGTAATHAATVNRQGALFGRAHFGAANWSASGRLALRGAGDLRTPEGVLDGTFLRNVDGGGGASFARGPLRGGFFASGLQRTYGLPDGDGPDESAEIRMRRLAVQGRLAWETGPGRQPVTLRLNAARYGHDEVELAGGEENLDLSYLQHMLGATLTVPHGGIGPIARGAVGAGVYLRDMQVGGDEALTPDAAGATFSAFTFQEAPLGRRVRLQIGVRGEVARLSVRPNERYPAAGERSSPGAVSAALGLHATPGAGVEVGLQLAQAYRVPTLEERLAHGPHAGAGVFEVGDPDLGLEQALGADAFVRFTRGSFRAEVAAFWSTIRDFVVFNPTGEIDAPSGLPVFQYEPDRARLSGAEFQAELQPAENLRLRLTSDYVRGTRIGDQTPLPRMPPLRGTIGLTRDLRDGWVGVTLRGVAAQNRVAPNEDVTPGYAWLGLEGGLRVGPGRSHLVVLRIDNVLDTAYRDHLSRIEHREAPMPGRNVALTYRAIW